MKRNKAVLIFGAGILLVFGLLTLFPDIFAPYALKWTEHGSPAAVRISLEPMTWGTIF